MIPNTASNYISEVSSEIIRKELGRILSRAFSDNVEIIDGLDEIKNVSAWYREAKEDPTNIPTIIINELIQRLTQQIEPIFTSFLVNKIKIEAEARTAESAIKLIEINFSVKPFVEYLKKIDGTECNKIKTVFAVAIAGKLKDITIHSDINGKHILIGSLSSNLSISIDRGTISTIYAPITLIAKPIILHHNEYFKIENISFDL